MRTIVCKKCGATIDATLGECPNCGAVYYILPDDDKKLEWAMNPDTDIDATHVFGKNELKGTRTGSAHSTRDIVNADNDELFNTSVWKVSKDPDETRMFRSQPTAGNNKPAAAPPVRPAASRPAVQRTVSQNTGAVNVHGSGNGSGTGGKPPDYENDMRKKWLIVSAVALLAVLTLVLAIMGGVFSNFGGSDSSKTAMPNVIGFTQETATTVLKSMNLKVKTKSEESDQVVGTVIEQSVKENAKVASGDTVTLTISSGKKTVSTTEEYAVVPSLTGETYDAAKADLDNLGLEITKDADEYNDLPVGQVVSQTPMKGAKLQKGDLVTVTLSKGPEPSPTPSAHNITVSTGTGGSISPKGIISVEDGKNQIFTITPDDGYKISEVNVDGTDVGAVSSYPFTKVTGDHTIYAVFEKVEETPSPTPTPSDEPSPTPKPNGNP